MNFLQYVRQRLRYEPFLVLESAEFLLEDLVVGFQWNPQNVRRPHDQTPGDDVSNDVVVRSRKIRHSGRSLSGHEFNGIKLWIEQAREY